MFRSVLLPAKAVVMNTLSILASYGALVFIFQDGHFQDPASFRVHRHGGGLHADHPVLHSLRSVAWTTRSSCCPGSRRSTTGPGDNAASVAKGLEKSGKIITSAAVIVVAVGIAFSAADIVIIKALGLGIAIAVFLDATVVRTLLVPATMRLLGDWNWWAPRWLLRLLPRASDE